VAGVLARWTEAGVPDKASSQNVPPLALLPDRRLPLPRSSMEDQVDSSARPSRVPSPARSRRPAIEHGSSAPAQFHVDQARADTWVVTVIGEVDFANQQRFQAAVDRALAAGPARLVLDLAGVRFMDSSALRILILATQREATVELRAPSRAVQRLLELSGLATLLRIVE